MAAKSWQKYQQPNSPVFAETGFEDWFDKTFIQPTQFPVGYGGDPYGDTRKHYQTMFEPVEAPFNRGNTTAQSQTIADMGAQRTADLRNQFMDMYKNPVVNNVPQTASVQTTAGEIMNSALPQTLPQYGTVAPLDSSTVYKMFQNANATAMGASTPTTPTGVNTSDLFYEFSPEQIAGLAQGRQIGMDGSVVTPEPGWSDDLSTMDMFNMFQGVAGLGLGAYAMNKQHDFMENKIGLARDELKIKQEDHKATQSRRGFA